MALIVETGAGIVGAASYAAIDTIDAYWAARPHTTFATAWAAGSGPQKEGAARETTDFLDATYGPHYKGMRKGYVQGLLHPRTGATDEAGYPLPDMPPELVKAVCELSARAISKRLADDKNLSGAVSLQRAKAGPVEVTTEYKDGAALEKRFGFVAGLLAPILDGTQPGASGSWAWR